MIESIQIKNFKSVVNLSISLGGFNVLIGENGCGKSNILEAIGFGAAASADKIDYEFLGSRGIRVTNPEFMYSAFADLEDLKKRIEILYKLNEGHFTQYQYFLTNDLDNSKKWINVSKDVIGKDAGDKLARLLFENDEPIRNNELNKFLEGEGELTKRLLDIAREIEGISKKNKTEEKTVSFFKFIFDKYLKDRYSNDKISNFIIYSPEQSSLRKFEETNQIYPLGIKGEGVFQYLRELELDEKEKNTLLDIKNNLTLLDWYDSFDLPKGLMSNEFSLNIKDKYLNPTLEYFDQRSTNEGFLYLLFYSTLFISQKTPAFFAIDNIDTSLNPKLCQKLIKSLVELSKKHNKQVIVTTQNPAVLDGLDLKDDNQRLFVVRRNDDGHTKATRIRHKEEREKPLSEIWTGGYIGGLPENF